jgi:antitoxin FitA
MVAVQIRDVPEDVRDALAERARQRGQSLQAFLLALIETEARRSYNAVVLSRLAKRTDGTRTQPGQTAREVAADRRQRATELDEPG